MEVKVVLWKLVKVQLEQYITYPPYLCISAQPKSMQMYDFTNNYPTK